MLSLLKLCQTVFAVKHYCDERMWWTYIKSVRLSQHFLQLQEGSQNILYAVILSLWTLFIFWSDFCSSGISKV